MSRLIDYFMYPSHILLHTILGGYIFIILMNFKHQKTNLYILFIIGCILGVFPDVLKFYGDITAHSIVIIPVYGNILAY